MKRYVNQVLTARLAALALSTLCFLHAPARAQGMPEYNVVFPSVGLVADQRLVLTILDPEGVPLRAQAQIRHSGGANFVFCDGSVRSVGAGASYSFNLNRSDISVPGEDGTGRIQLLPSISVVRQTSSETNKPIVASMEIVEIGDGTSNTISVGAVMPSGPIGGNGNETVTSGFGDEPFMGMLFGQKLRVTLSNLRASESDSLPARVKLFDANGGLIAQSPELVIPPREFLSFELDRSDLLLPGERGTGRLPVRARIETTGNDPSLITIYTRVGLIASFEIIDNLTGRTTAHQNNLKQMGLGFHNFNDTGN